MMVFRTRHLPFQRHRASFIGLLVVIALWIFSLQACLSQNSVQRDQEAIAILNQTIAAGGGQQLLTSIRDVTETGTVIYYWTDREVTGSVTVKSRGAHQFRIDADLPEGRRTTVVNGEGGSLIEGNGRRTPILGQSATDLGSLTLPYISVLAAVQNPSMSIVYGGLVTHDSVSAYDVRVVKVFDNRQDPSGNRGDQEARDFYIDPKTFLIGAVSDRIHHGGPRDEGVPHEILYSDYQLESGILAPLTIVETVRGSTGVRITLSEVAFASRLRDSDFAW